MNEEELVMLNEMWDEFLKKEIFPEQDKDVSMSEIREHVYKVRYKMEPGSFTREQIKEGGHGGADALIIGSIIKYENGSTSTMWFSNDGEQEKEMTPDDVFKAWVLLAAQLSETLPETGKGADRRQLCKQVFETVRTAIKMARIEKEGFDGSI